MDEFSRQRLRTAFLALTDYSPLDLLAANYEDRIFMTRNGGRYEVSENLKSVRRLAGPPVNVEDRRLTL